MAAFFIATQDMYHVSIVPPLRLAFIMWLVYTLEVYLHLDLSFLGILPLTLKGMIGIATAPIVHGSFSHLLTNTVPLVFLGATLYFFYNTIASKVFIHCYFFTNILVWFFGREFYHIGSSGLVYGLAFFLICSGIFRRDFKALFISVVVIFVYGGLIYGISPANQQISWEAHLMGAIVGSVSAFTFRKSKIIE